MSQETCRDLVILTSAQWLRQGYSLPAASSSFSFLPKLLFSSNPLKNMFLSWSVCACVLLCLPAKSHWYRTNCQNKSCSIQNRLSCQGRTFLPPISWQTLSQQLSVVFSELVSPAPPPGRFKVVESGHFLCVSGRSVLWQSAKLFSPVKQSLLGTLKTFCPA